MEYRPLLYDDFRVSSESDVINCQCLTDKCIYRVIQIHNPFDYKINVIRVCNDALKIYAQSHFYSNSNHNYLDFKYKLILDFFNKRYDGLFFGIMSGVKSNSKDLKNRVIWFEPHKNVFIGITLFDAICLSVKEQSFMLREKIKSCILDYSKSISNFKKYTSLNREIKRLLNMLDNYFLNEDEIMTIYIEIINSLFKQETK